MDALLGDAPPAALVAPTPLHLRGPLPAVPPPARSATDRLDLAGGARADLSPPAGAGAASTTVDLRLPRGTLTVVTGRVGAGKTTLLRTLLGLLPREAGEIRWNGQVVDDAAAFFVPPRAAYTAQVPRLFSETLKQNILLGLPDDPAALDAAVRGAVLEHDVQALEAGLETPVGTRGVKLSGGQVQRTAAARMLVRDAELLVIDDLSSALDVETERDAVGAPVRRRRRDLPGRLAPPRRAAPRRPHHRAEGGPRRGRGHARRAAGDLRGDARPLARRRRSGRPGVAPTLTPSGWRGPAKGLAAGDGAGG